jgi:hypothetical protein
MSTGRQAARIAAWAVAFRLFSALAAFIMNVVFPTHGTDQFASPFGATRAFWDPFTRYDSGWLFQIARYGYHYTPNGRDNIAYFPAYPLLMRYVGRAMGASPADMYRGGVIVSWVSFVVAMVLLYQLARLDLPRRRAERAVLLAAIFPFAFFYGVVYTESLFLAATLACFLFFRTGRWIRGGLCGAVATATRVNGIMMWPALAWMVYTQLARGSSTEAGSDRRRAIASAVLGLLLVVSGIGAYSAYIYSVTGNPIEWAATRQRWGYYPGGAPWTAPVRLIGALLAHPFTYLATEPMAPYDTLNGVTALVFIVATPFVWQRYGAAYGLFMAANLLLPLSSGQFEGLGRYCAVLFPFFIWLASVRSRAAVAAAATASAVLYGFCLALFTNLYPLF